MEELRLAKISQDSYGLSVKLELLEIPETVPQSSDASDNSAEATVRRFAALAFCRADMLFELDQNKKIIFCAGTVDSLLGKSQKVLTGTSFLDLIAPESREMVGILLSEGGADARINDVLFQLVMKNDKVSTAALAGYRVPCFDNNFFLAIKVAPRAVAAHGRRPLDRGEETNVLNPKAFASVAADRIQALQDAGGKAEVSMIKIDNIDEIKNTLSAEKQSKVFGAIGEILNENSLGGDTGGQIDESNFSVLHSDETSADDICKKITAVAENIGVGVTTTSTTIDAEMGGLTEEQIQQALLHTMKVFSKGDGKLSHKNISGMFEEKMAETVKAVEAFRRVCTQKHFDLVYMPICSLKTGAVHHFEALTRFRGNAGGLDSSPYELITLAEEVGIISEFDFVVAEKAIEMINEQKGSGRLVKTAVNVSGHSISSDEFVGTLHDLLVSVPGLGEYLSLEITESAEITDLEHVNASIQKFRESGFKVSLDDFGAGAASFDYLNSFDVDTVKFDGPVVQRAYRTQKGKAFLASMATLCRQSEIETIAEMVETEELAEFLNDCGVDLGQGYYFGKPDYDIASFKEILP